MTIVAVCDPDEDLMFTEVRRNDSALQYHRELASERRRVLAEIRDQYRHFRVEDEDDSDVVGFGQREITTVTRPPRVSPLAR